ncbi:MAG TPA: glycosyltransferase [Thermoanaerobaculia bacterium]|nr:glycosyltransferase [Thermoanaerobaculia bacterium]
MRILLTNRSLQQRGGSELYVRDVACALAARGLQPLAYAPRLGAVAEELRSRAVPVVERLELLAEPPDLIHGQHHLQTMAALLAFPGTPAIFVCHGWLPWDERPPRFPRILRYVAVDRLRRERLVSEEGIPPERVEVIANFVDLERFGRRAEPLPPRPRRALVFGNQPAPDSAYVQLVRAACEREGITLETAGFASGRPLDRPEEVLAGVDLVFARGRSAMEAMATGAAVILSDVEGLGPLVTPDRVEELAALNFGIGAFAGPHRLETLLGEIRRYQPADAAAVSDWIHRHAPLGPAVDRLVGLYRRVADEWAALRPEERGTDEARATSEYLQDLDGHLRRQSEAIAELHREGGRAHLAAAAEAERREAVSAALRSAEAGLDHLEAECRDLRDELALLRGTTAVRARDWLLRRRRLAELFRRIKPGG